MEEVDIAPALSGAALAVKDENELVCNRAALGMENADFTSAQCEMPPRPASPL